MRTPIGGTGWTMNPTRYFEFTPRFKPVDEVRIYLKRLMLLVSILIGITAWQVVIAQSNADKSFPKVGAVSESPTNDYHPVVDESGTVYMTPEMETRLQFIGDVKRVIVEINSNR
jgi:hypothetical protein